MRHKRLWCQSAVWWGFTMLIVSPALGVDDFDPYGHGSGYPEAARGSITPMPTLRAYQLNGNGIEMDGHLDDPAWRAAEAGTGFTQFDPDRGASASEETVLKVVYDDKAIYFGIACYEHDMTNVSSNLSRRDHIENSDIVSIYLDPYHDRTTGYNFRINLHAVQEDHYIFNDGDRDRDWNAVWEAETYSDHEGWYAEIRIPFSQVRYRPAESMTWGLQVYRFMHGRGEDTAWANWDRNAGGFVSRWGELTGLEGVRAPRQLEIVPYLVQSTTDPSQPGPDESWEQYQNMGADIKYGLTADLTLTATIQPDFGQVEADPALLNLSPFETFFEEKRPFFIEGSRFFQHPDFNLFYSRRIGIEDVNSRIRFASKLIGKTANGVSVAALFAATDITAPGQAYNPFKGGTHQTYYGVGRLGKEFHDGDHRLNIMGTVVQRNDVRTLANDDPRFQRDAYSTGLDFDLNFHERTYNIQGSVVGTRVDPPPVIDDLTVDHAARQGTGGALDVRKIAGVWRGGVGGRWEHDQLDPNDMGILFAPDEISSYGWLSYRYNADGKESRFNSGNVNFNAHKSWLYAGRTFFAADEPSVPSWTYPAGHRQSAGWNVNTFWQTRGFWGLFAGFWNDLEGSSKYSTRFFDGVRGPLLTTPRAYGYWAGLNTDWRKKFSFNSQLEQWWSDAGNRTVDVEFGLRWVQSSRLNHRLSISFMDGYRDAQWLDNFANDSGGIAGVSYVYGSLQQQTWDLTLRSNVLFSRNQSLEIYLQPFLTVGDYLDARELVTPDSYDLQLYTADDYNVDDHDFTFGAVNLNMVYRWEYRPGSTLFLVWTHSRERYEERGFFNEPSDFDSGFSSDPLFANEPENRFLVKLSYWFSI